MKVFFWLSLFIFLCLGARWCVAQSSLEWDDATADTIDELTALGATAEAAILLDDLVDRFPNWPRPRLQRAGLRLLQGDTRGALVDLDWLSETRLPSDLRAVVNDRTAEARNLRRGPLVKGSFFLQPTTNANGGTLANTGQIGGLDLVIAAGSQAQIGLHAGGQFGIGYGLMTNQTMSLSLDVGTHFSGTTYAPEWPTEIWLQPYAALGLNAEVKDRLRLDQSIALAVVADDDFNLNRPAIDADTSLVYRSNERVSVGASLAGQFVQHSSGDTSKSLTLSPSLQLQITNRWALGLSGGVEYLIRDAVPHFAGEGLFIGGNSYVELTPAARMDIEARYEIFESEAIFPGYFEAEHADHLSGSISLSRRRLFAGRIGIGLRYDYARTFSNISIRARESHGLTLFSTF